MLRFLIYLTSATSMLAASTMFAQTEPQELKSLGLYLQRQSQGGYPGWATCFDKVTRRENGIVKLTDWLSVTAFGEMESATTPDHTQRADFMGRVGEVVQRRAVQIGVTYKSNAFELAALQWEQVIQYMDWEEGRWSGEAAHAVKWDLRSRRDLASYNRIYCMELAAKWAANPRSAPSVRSIGDHLPLFATLSSENIGKKVLAYWRKILGERYGSVQSVIRVSSVEAKDHWQKMLTATDRYVLEAATTPLPRLNEIETRSHEADRRALPPVTNQSV